MSEWKTRKLSEIIEIIGGGTPKRSKSEYWNGAIPWLSVADFNNNLRYVSSSLETITELGLKESSTKLLKEGQLIISARGTVGCLAQLSIPMAFNQSCYGLHGKDGIIDNGFLYYALKNKISELKQKTHGAVFDTITRDTFDYINISYPTISEQQKIAKYLGDLDDKIHLNTQTNQTLEQIAQAIYKSWFVDFEPTRAKAAVLAAGGSAAEAQTAAMSALSGQPPAALAALAQQNPARHQQLATLAAAFPSALVSIDSYGEVPQGWEVKRIGDVVQKIPVGKKYSQKTVMAKGKIPVLDQGRSGLIGYHNDKAGVQASLEKPVIVFANHTCYMRLITYDFSAIQNVFAFRGKDCNVLWLYLATLGKQQFVEYKGHFPDFLIKEIVMPPKAVTELFGNQLKHLFQKMATNNQENEVLSEIRDTLLPKLLNGELPADTSFQTASEAV